MARRIFDVHSHWGTKRGYPLRSTAELSKQQYTWRSDPKYHTEEEMAAAALQYVRKISGMRAPAKANAEAFDRAVAAVTEATHELLGSLEIRRRPVAAAD